MLEEASEYLESVSSILCCTWSQPQAFLLQLWLAPVFMLAQHGHLLLTAGFVGFQNIKPRKCCLACGSISATLTWKGFWKWDWNIGFFVTWKDQTCQGCRVFNEENMIPSRCVWLVLFSPPINEFLKGRNIWKPSRAEAYSKRTISLEFKRRF